jgi:hypothetical protein
VSANPAIPGPAGAGPAVIRSIGRCFLSLLVSGGLWGVAWIYHTAREVGEDGRGKEDTSPGLRVVGAFIPIVNWFVLYFSWRDIEKYCKQVGAPDFPLVLYFIGSFIPIVNIILYVVVQGKMNEAFRVGSGGQAQDAPMYTIDWVTIVLGFVFIVLAVVIGISVN